MKHEVEIEYKQLVTKQQFDALLEYFKVSATDFTIQTNYYLDTNNKTLLNSKRALRVRQVENDYTLTLKEQETTDIINEYHERVTKTQLDQLSFENSEIIKKLNIDMRDIGIISKLITHRALIKTDSYMLFFDYNEYDGHTDYEIEMEVNSVEDEHYFDAILKQFNITKTKTLPKIVRATTNK